METSLWKIIRDSENRKREILAVQNEYRKFFLQLPLGKVIDWRMDRAQRFSYNLETLKNYTSLFNEMAALEIIDLKKSADQFKNSNTILQLVLKKNDWSNVQKKLRINALIFLSSFIEQETFGLIEKIKMPKELTNTGPAKEGMPKIAESAEVGVILKAAKEINPRDALLLEFIYFSGVSLKDVLSLDISNLHFENGTVSFLCKGSKKNISNQGGLVERLKEYIQDTQSRRGACACLFVSNQGKPLNRTQIQKTLEKASKQADLPYVITTKMIQRSRDETIQKLEKPE